MPTSYTPSNTATVIQELQTAVEQLTAANSVLQANNARLEGRLAQIVQHLQGGGGPGFAIKF